VDSGKTLCSEVDERCEFECSFVTLDGLHQGRGGDNVLLVGEEVNREDRMGGVFRPVSLG
jgi:hypothetical protein